MKKKSNDTISVPLMDDKLLDKLVHVSLLQISNVVFCCFFFGTFFFLDFSFSQLITTEKWEAEEENKPKTVAEPASRGREEATASIIFSLSLSSSVFGHLVEREGCQKKDLIETSASRR